jgi:hypothetical protein
MGFIFDLLFGGEREPRINDFGVNDFRVRPRRNKPIYCTRCGKYISDVYLYDDAYYGRHCLEILLTQAQEAELKRELERELEGRPYEVGPCTKCGKPFGPTLNDVVTHVCNEKNQAT